MEKVFEIPSDKSAHIKVVLELDQFKAAGYTLTTAQSLGLPGTHSFLYIKADSGFFTKNKEHLPFDEPKNSAEVIKRIKDAEDAAQAGMGFIFS